MYFNRLTFTTYMVTHCTQDVRKCIGTYMYLRLFPHFSIQSFTRPYINITINITVLIYIYINGLCVYSSNTIITYINVVYLLMFCLILCRTHLYKNKGITKLLIIDIIKLLYIYIYII